MCYDPRDDMPSYAIVYVETAGQAEKTDTSLEEDENEHDESKSSEMTSRD
jgi:hypothetical protein